MGRLTVWCQVWIEIRREIHQQLAPLAFCCQLRGLQVREVGADSPQSVTHPLMKLSGRVPGRTPMPLPPSGHFQSLRKVLSTLPVILQRLSFFTGLLSSQPTAQRMKRQLILIFDEQQLSRLRHTEELKLDTETRRKRRREEIVLFPRDKTAVSKFFILIT